MQVGRAKKRHTLLETGLGILLNEFDRVRAGEEGEHRIRLLRQNVGEIGLIVEFFKARPLLVDDFAAGLLEFVREGDDLFLASRVVHAHRHDALGTRLNNHAPAGDVICRLECGTRKTSG